MARRSRVYVCIGTYIYIHAHICAANSLVLPGVTPSVIKNNHLGWGNGYLIMLMFVFRIIVGYALIQGSTSGWL